MILLWVTSNKPGARLIRWGSSSDCSHFAIAFDETPNGYGIVFHSELLGGVHLDWWKAFKEEHTIVHALRVNKVLTVEEEEVIYQSIVSRFFGQSYDWSAFMYWSWCILKYKIFGTPIPSINMLNSPGEELCTEIAKGIADIEWLKIPKITDYSMILPHTMYEIFKTSPMLESVSVGEL